MVIEIRSRLPGGKQGLTEKNPKQTFRGDRNVLGLDMYWSKQKTSDVSISLFIRKEKGAEAKKPGFPFT